MTKQSTAPNIEEPRVNHKRFAMTIIIPTYNREDSLPLLLARLGELAERIRNVEVIIIDDGSTDSTKGFLADVELTSDFALRTFFQKNAGAANARNLGVREAQADVVLFLDSDIIPSDELIETHLEFHRKCPRENFVLRGRVEPHQSSHSIRKIQAVIPDAQSKFEELGWTEFRSNNISVKREFLLKTGGFDGDLSAHQDTELGHRLGKIGMRLFHSNKAIGYHYHPVSLKEYFRYAEKYGMSRAIWFFKAPDLIEDTVRAGKEDRYGFISWGSPLSKKIKHLFKVIFVNRFTVDPLIAIGKTLERRGSKHYFFFYRQAYQYFSRRTFKDYLREIRKGRFFVKRPLRICVLAGPMLPEFSGAAIQSLNLARYFKAHKYEPFYISPTFRQNLARESYVHGIKCHRVYMKSETSLHKILFSIKVFGLLLRFRDRYDIIHIHGGGFLMTGATFVSKLLGKRCIYKMTSLGEDDPYKIRQLRGSWFKYPLFRMADKVIAISSALKDAYNKCQLDEEKLCFIPNAVDLERFSPVSENQKKEIRKKLKLPEKTFIVTCVASISRRKGIDFLLKAWEHVMAAHEDVLLVIVGGYKEYDKEFTAQVRELLTLPEYAKKVLLPGMRSDVEKFLQASDMFAFTSHREGFATVQIEAMGCALPCVCTYMEGISDDIFTNGENGVVVKNASPEVFAKQVMDLMGDPQRRKMLAANARESVKNKFSLNQVGDQYLRLYASLMSDMHFEGNLILAQT